ncbi:MAG TPA: hypothetical protein VEH05_10935 [Streptosporangiaceae bacterium]|nr:hypothetical protein [Streptosporangiaceae bacterium]
MTGMLRVRRSKGAIGGLLLVLLGIWGALIPFVGPYFHYAYTPDKTWVGTNGRLWLEVVPGAVTLAGGLIMLWSRLRPMAVFGAWLAALAGAWFALGGVVAQHWASLPTAGQPVGSGMRALLEEIGFFTGLGLVIVFVAALALGRFTVFTMGRLAAPAAAEPPREREPVGAGRGMARIVPVPVFRGRQRSADTAGS